MSEKEKKTIQSIDKDFLVKFLEDLKYLPMHEKYRATLTDRQIWNIYFLIEYRVVKMKKINRINGNFEAIEVFRDPRADLLLEALREEPDPTNWQKIKKTLGPKMSKVWEIITQIGVAYVTSKIT